MTAPPPITLDRREVVTQLLHGRGNALVVSGLGSSTFDVFAAGDSPLNFYLWGAMGGAAMVGMGLALAQPTRRILVVTGDGEMLMGMGSLATIGAQPPKNLAIVVLDNQSYGETGMQPSHTARGVDLAGIASAANFETTATIYTRAELDAWINAVWTGTAPLLAVVKITASQPPLRFPLRDGTHIKNRFREALLGAQAFA
jgi:thiamine pyrophosphate-dependent acetolactate synthase large subunit-like protein